MSFNIISFDCQYLKTIFNRDNFWVVSVLVDKRVYPNVKFNKYDNVTLIGDNLFQLDPEVSYHVTGELIMGKYGPSYQVRSITRDIPKTTLDIRRFLETVLTYRQASQLIEHYPNIIDIIKEGRESEIDFSLLKGITPNNFQRIANSILNNFALIDICAVFYNMISLNMMKKLYNHYGSIDKIKQVLHDQPYSALYDIDHVGFKTADETLLKIEDAIKSQIDNGERVDFQFEYPLKTSSDRCLNCMRYYLEQNEQNDGNTKMLISDLQAKVVAYTKEAAIFFKPCLDNDNFYVNQAEQTISLKRTYETEKYIATKLIEANKTPILWDINTGNFNKVGDFMLTESQQSVQKFLCQNNVVLLQGPAGSGKSSSVKALTDMLVANNINFVMGCPSAKAAKVLRKYTKYDAKTIHRMLGYNMGKFTYCQNNPLPVQLVIIDETSMLDIYLAKSLLEAIDFKQTKLLLIGDRYQLPSVSAGNFFHDMIESKLFPVVSLTEIFRYSEGGLIKVATDIRNSKRYLPDRIEPNQQVINFGKSYCFAPKSKEKCVDFTVSLYQKLAATHNLEDIMVLTAQNKGDYGALVLNNKIQKAINHNTNGLTVEHNDVEVTYLEGDIVMNIVNDYHSVVCDEVGTILKDGDDPKEVLIANGETGRITKVSKEGLVIRYDDVYIWRSKSNLDKIQLAYAESIHKSQGSGCDYVIILSPSAHTYMLSSPILYVAVTRAKKCTFHIGDLKTVNNAVKKKPNLNRKTNLQQLFVQLKES